MSEVITDASQTCNGRAKENMGEALIDIECSEMGYLGYYGGAGYGLTWRVLYDSPALGNPSHGVERPGLNQV